MAMKRQKRHFEERLQVYGRFLLPCGTVSGKIDDRKEAMQ